MMKLRGLRIKGLKGRWMFTGTGVTVLIVLLGVWLIVASIHTNYYHSVETGLESKATTASEFLEDYVTGSYTEFYRSAMDYTEGFEDRDRIELQFLSSGGRVETSSYGFSAGTRPGTPDITEALSTGEMSSWSGRRDDTGEHVLAVSAPLKNASGTVIGLIRYVTSLRLVDEQVFRLAAATAGVGLLIIMFIILSNLYFINSITAPIVELTGIARRISDGSYGIQAVKLHDDEIGDLIDSINDMSVKLGRAEKMQTEFISSISHELRTPLTAITGWSETLAFDPAIKGESLRGITIISKEAARLTKMVEDLLEFTRIEDGRFNLTLEKIDVAAELEEAIFTYGELLRQRSVSQIRLADHKHPGRIFVDTVNNSRTQNSVDSRKLSATVKHQSVNQCMRIMACCRVHHHPFWLVDHQQFVVFIKYIQRYILRKNIRFLFLRNIQPDFCSFKKTEAGADRFSGHCDPSRFQNLLKIGSGKI